MIIHDPRANRTHRRLVVVTGRGIADAYTAANVAACGSDCTTAIAAFLKQAKTGTNGTVYNLATAVMYVVPALIGIFWGAPLIARELKTGTHRLAWNQSVTRTRWLATKLAIIGGATAATACEEWVGTLGLRQDLTYHPANHFWPLQWTEAGIFLALAALLVGFCFWWTRRRVT